MLKMLNRLLLKIAVFCVQMSNKLTQQEAKKNMETATLFTLDTIKNSKEFAFLNRYATFSSFSEGMSSSDYCRRHDAASQIVGWYVYQQGSPLLEDLIKAAQILLEDYPFTQADVSYLVGAWKDQASAMTDEVRTEAEQREQAIFVNLLEKNKLKN